MSRKKAVIIPVQAPVLGVRVNTFWMERIDPILETKGLPKAVLGCFFGHYKAAMAKYKSHHAPLDMVQEIVAGAWLATIKDHAYLSANAMNEWFNWDALRKEIADRHAEQLREEKQGVHW